MKTCRATGRARAWLRKSWRLAAVLAGGLLTSACMGPEVMIATNVASAAFQAAVEHAEKNKPTPSEAWRASRREYLEDQSRAGNPTAQYALGQLYQFHRRTDAHYWICEAANNGHPAAQVQLGHWYNEDRLQEDPWPFIPVRPDNREAYLWYQLAEANGDDSAALFSEPLVNGALSGEDLKTARALVDGWAPGSCGVLATADADVAAVDR